MSVLDAKRWDLLQRKLRGPEVDATEFLSPPPAPPASDPLTHQAVYALLLWEASTPLAHAALRRILANVVDYNELRVCQVEHIAEWLQPNYPLATERALRLRAFLSDVYLRQQSVQLSPLLLGSKKDTQQTLASIDGATPFVVQRVLGLGLSRPACPIDERLFALLRAEKVVLSHATIESASMELADMTSDEARMGILARLQHWSDTLGVSPQRHAPGHVPVPIDEPPSDRGGQSLGPAPAPTPASTPAPRAPRSSKAPPHPRKPHRS